MQSLSNCNHISFMLPLKKSFSSHIQNLLISKKYFIFLQTLICISADVLSEEAILKWYKEAHVAKGKSVFLDQMKKFVEWLQNAEEGMTSFEELCKLFAKHLFFHILVVPEYEVFRTRNTKQQV